MLITVKWSQFKPSQPPRRVVEMGLNQAVTLATRRHPGGATSSRPPGANSGCHGERVELRLDLAEFAAVVGCRACEHGPPTTAVTGKPFNARAARAEGRTLTEGLPKAGQICEESASKVAMT